MGRWGIGEGHARGDSAWWGGRKRVGYLGREGFVRCNIGDREVRIRAWVGRESGIVECSGRERELEA